MRGGYSRDSPSDPPAIIPPLRRPCVLPCSCHSGETSALIRHFNVFGKMSCRIVVVAGRKMVVHADGVHGSGRSVHLITSIGSRDMPPFSLLQ